MVSRFFKSDRAPRIVATCVLAALLMLSSSSFAGDLDTSSYQQTPNASFQRSQAVDFEGQKDNWSAGIGEADESTLDAEDSLVRLEQPSILLEPDGFGIVRPQSTPSFRLSDYALSIDLIRLGEAFKATAQWYQRPRKVAPDAELVLDSFYDIGREVVDEGLVLVRSRSEQKGLQAKLGPTWMHGGPAARLKVSF